MSFREWLGASEGGMTELATWFAQVQSRILSSIQKSPGYISVSVSSLFNSVAPSVPSTGLSRVGMASGAPMALAASVVHSGPLLGEATAKGWKGDAAGDAAGAMGLGWSASDVGSFGKAMNAGKKSLPVLVGKEMGLLFEVEVFIFLVQTFKLKPVGVKDLAWALGEQGRLVGEIESKVGLALGKLVVEFIRGHASGSSGGMGNLIYGKAMALVRECIVDSIEFTGGDGGAYSARLKSDTADLRIGCEKYLPGMRGDVGFSLKAVTETQIEVRSFGGLKAASLLGVGRRDLSKLKGMMSNPLYEGGEVREELLNLMKLAADKNFASKPRKFASLLEFLVTGGADTIPAYRMLLRADSEPGWSGAIGKDFVAGEGPGRKLGAKVGSAPVIDVKMNKTYVKLTYMVKGGNHYGTSVQFEPDADGRSVSVAVSNLLSKGGRGY